jgi:hypothetical protein
MRAIVVLALTAIAIAFGYHEASTRHIGAPADPYPTGGYSCPAGSHYVSFWERGTRTPVQAGVIHYLGWTEIASCGASVTITGG